jgi:hypothetical protein
VTINTQVARILYVPRLVTRWRRLLPCLFKLFTRVRDRARRVPKKPEETDGRRGKALDGWRSDVVSRS